MTKKVLFTLSLLSFWVTSSVFAQLSVTQSNNALTLAQSLVGSGVTVSNATISGNANQSGTFTNGNSANLGFNSGVVLSTGNVASVPQGGSAFASTAYSGAGDATLNAIASGSTQDASVLQFDFVAQGNTLNFRYVFGSEEYPEYVCSQYNDVFGFFISGPNPGGGNYSNSNIALIPNTSLSVAINAVNSGQPGGGYSSGGCTSLAYSQYYISNTNGSFIVYDGYTTVLNANISVVPCQTYHLKLAIADVSDGLYDSGVFLEASSFVSQASSVTAFFDPGFTSTFEGCVGGGFTITVPNLATSSTAINYTVSGTATNGVDYPPLSGTAYVNPGGSTALVYVDPFNDNLSEGTETVTITIYDPCSGLPVDSATININEPPVDTAYASTSLACLGQQVQLTATGGGTYSWTPTTGLSNPNIANPTFTITSDMVYTANVTFGNCVSNWPVYISADSLDANILSVMNTTICPGNTDTLVAQSDYGISPLTYQWSPAGQVSNPNSEFVFTSPLATTVYTVTISDAAGCSASASHTIDVATNLQLSLGTDVKVCPENSPYTLGVPGGTFDTYLWSTGDTSASISVSSSGSFSVTVTSGQCTYTSDTISIQFLVPVNPTLAGTGFCTGSQTTLQVAQSSYTNILWSTGDTTNSIAVGIAGDYYYSANDSNGCFIHSDTATIVENQVPVVNATASPDTICPGTTSTLSSGSPAGLSYQWSTTETTSSITVSAAGTYYLTVSNAVCASYDTVSVYEYPNPQPTVVGDTTVCNGEPVSFNLTNGPFQSYYWSNGDSAVTGITVTTAGTYNVTVNDGACNWVSNDVHLNNFPTPVPTLSDTGACLGNNVILFAENGLVNILWNTLDTTLAIIVTNNGTYYYTAADVNGCPVNSDTATITFQAPPTVNVTATLDSICPGSSSVLTANGVGSNLTYSWSPTGDTSSAITVSQGGTYIVEVNDFFCPAFDTIEIFEYQFPPVNLPTSDSVCAGESQILTPTGGPYISYTWSDGNTTTSDTVLLPGVYNVTVNNGTCDLVSNSYTLANYPDSHPHLADTGACQGNVIVLSASPNLPAIMWNTGSQTDTIQVAVSGDYYYTGIDQHQCTVVSDTATVTFSTALPVNVTASPDTVCQGHSSTLTANAQGNNLTYLWQPGGDTTGSITVSQTGTYYVTVDDGACPGNDSVTIYQYQPVQVLLNADTTVCPGNNVTVAPNGSFVTYTWNNGPATSSITVNTAGSYWVTVNDGHCDYVSDTFHLSNFQVPSAAAYSDTNVCTGQPVTLQADGNYSNYGWSSGQTGVSIIVTNPGDYSYTATDGNGCQVKSDTATVTNRPYPNANIIATPAVICLNQGRTTLDAGSEQGVSYTWQPTGANTPTIQVTQAGTYIVAAELAGCIAFDTIMVNTADTPVLNMDPFVLSCCVSVTLDPAPQMNYTYVWSDSSTNSTLTVNSTNNASEVYSVTATTADGCTATAFTTVLIKCINAVATTLPDTIMMGDTAQLNVVTDYNTAFSYNWTPTSSLTDPTVQNPMAVPTEETHYTVVVIDTVDGCVDTAEVTVFVLYGDKIAMPNAFTPNGDGKNDVFYPVLLGEYQQVIEFRIYDRWGAMIHNGTEPWDGNFSGKGQPAGTYVYYIIVRVPDPQNMGSTKDIKLNGSFTLLR